MGKIASWMFATLVGCSFWSLSHTQTSEKKEKSTDIKDIIPDKSWGKILVICYSLGEIRIVSLAGFKK